MATRTISATNSANSGDLKDGASYTYSGSTSHSGVVSGSVTSASLNISSIRCYASSWYLSVYVGGTKVAETVELNDKNNSSHSATYELEYLKPELLTATGSIKFKVYNNNSSSANTCNFRSGTATITVNYNPPAQPTVTTPTISSITQNNNGTYTIKWNACTGSNGSGSVTYGVYDDTAGGYLSQSVSGTSYTGNIPAYGTTRQYSVIAYYSGTSSGWSSIKSTTFTKPSINAPSSLKVNSSTSYTGATAPLTWTAGSFSSYLTGSLAYEIYKGDTLVTTTSASATSYTIPESTTKGWGTSAVTLKIRGKGTGLSNTSQGSTLYSSYTSTVSYTYRATVSTQPSNLKINGGTSYTGATAPLTWSAAVFSGGQTPTYSIRVNGTQLTTTTSTSYTIPESTTKSYTSAVTITVVATGGGATSNATNEVTYTYSPTLTGPSNLKINEATSYIGQAATLTWSEASLSNGGSIVYSVRKDGVEFATTTNTIYIITEDIAKTWGTSAISLTIVATGGGKTSSASNAVTFTYKSAYKTVEYYNGASWVKCIVYYHNGTKWVQTEIYYHNGSTWNPINS